jgi:hypothetical protein
MASDRNSFLGGLLQMLYGMEFADDVIEGAMSEIVDNENLQ